MRPPRRTSRQRGHTPGPVVEGDPLIAIGSLSQATGIPVETLRTWEARYGYPAAERRPSGHRRYPLSSVERLRRIAEGIARGLRAGDVVAASGEDLDRLLDAVRPAGSAPATPARPLASGDLLSLVRSYDGERLSQIFRAEHARGGPVELLETHVAPLLRAVGEAWARGELEVRHEHFLSEHLAALLGSLRLELEERADRPLVTMACLPSQSHVLGLHMAGLVVAAAGARVLHLGADVPIADIAAAARDQAARAVAVSVALAGGGPQTVEALRRLRSALPRTTRLLVGGEGAPPAAAGVVRLADLRALATFTRHLVEQHSTRRPERPPTTRRPR